MNNNGNYQKKEGQGSIWLNDRKQYDNQPDYTGVVVINGRDMRVAIWNKTAQNGRPFMSMQISEFQNQQQGQQASQTTPQQDYVQPQRSGYQQASQRPQTVGGMAPYNPFEQPQQAPMRRDLSQVQSGDSIIEDLPF